MSTTLLFGAIDTTSPYSAAVPAGTAVGDLLILCVNWAHTGALSSGVVTLPGGWSATPDYRLDYYYASTTNVSSQAVFSKTAVSGDIGSSISVSISGAAAAGVKCISVAGGYGIDPASWVSSTRAIGAAGSTWTPSPPTPTGYALGIMSGYWIGAGGGAGAIQSGGDNGWSASGTPPHFTYTLSDTTPPMSSPVLTDTNATARGVIAFAVKAVPDVVPGGPHLGSLRFGSRAGL